MTKKHTSRLKSWEKKVNTMKKSQSQSKPKSKKRQLAIGLIIIFFFEIMDVYPEKKAKEIILRIIKKLEMKNKKISQNFDVVYAYLKGKYDIWKSEKRKWDSEFASSLSTDISEKQIGRAHV